MKGNGCFEYNKMITHTHTHTHTHTDFDLEFAESVKKQIERLEKEEMIEGEEEKESEKGARTFAIS